MDDIVPSLLEAIQSQFDEQTLNSNKLKKAMQALKNKRATFIDVNEFAVEIGEILANVLGSNITAEVLPDGKMYFNIADRVLNSTLKKNHELISGFALDVQTLLNHEASLKLKSQVPELSQDKIDGLVNRISSEDDFNDIKWILQEPIVTFSQSVVDDTIKANVDFQAKAGLTPKITRTVVGKACKWCISLAGTFDYVSAPKDIYRRHERCRCIVDYKPGDGRRQNVWSKAWRDPMKDAKIEARKAIGLRQPDIQLPKSVSAKAKDIFAKHDIPVRGETAIKGGSTIKKVNIIGGKGVRRQIDDINRLVRENLGSKAEDWQKVTGIAEMSNGKMAEVHWYQARNVGKIEFKVKRWL